MASSKVANGLMMKHGQSANALFPSGTKKTPIPTSTKKASMPPFGQHNLVLDYVVNSGGVLKIATELASSYPADRVLIQTAELKVNKDMVDSVMEGAQASFFALNKAPLDTHVARGAAAQDKWLMNQSALHTKPESRKDKTALRFSKIADMFKQVSDKIDVVQRSIRATSAAISTKTSSGGNLLSAEKESEEDHGVSGFGELGGIGETVIEMSTEVDQVGKEMIKLYDSENKSAGLGPSGHRNRLMLGMGPDDATTTNSS